MKYTHLSNTKSNFNELNNENIQKLSNIMFANSFNICWFFKNSISLSTYLVF